MGKIILETVEDGLNVIHAGGIPSQRSEKVLCTVRSDELSYDAAVTVLEGLGYVVEER